MWKRESERNLRGKEKYLAREFQKEKEEVMRGREKMTTREWEVNIKRDRTRIHEREEDTNEGGDCNCERIQERDGALISEEKDSGIKNKERTKA